MTEDRSLRLCRFPLRPFAVHEKHRVMNKTEEFFQIDQLEKERERAGKSYLEFLRIPAMSAGLYTLPAGSADPQKPHQEDGVDYVGRGPARIWVGSDDRVVSSSSLLLV